MIVTSVLAVLIVIAFITCILSVMNKVPLWVPVFFLCVIELLRILPLGR